MSTATHSDTALPTWTVGDRMVKAREHAGMTQQEMADALGIGRRTITRHETNDSPPRQMLLAYAQVTGVPLWWIEVGDSADTQAVHMARCTAQSWLEAA